MAVVLVAFGQPNYWEAVEENANANMKIASSRLVLLLVREGRNFG